MTEPTIEDRVKAWEVWEVWHEGKSGKTLPDLIAAALSLSKQEGEKLGEQRGREEAIRECAEIAESVAAQPFHSMGNYSMAEDIRNRILSKLSTPQTTEKE